jgi:hypothetical protein
MCEGDFEEEVKKELEDLNWRRALPQFNLGTPAWGYIEGWYDALLWMVRKLFKEEGK